MLPSYIVTSFALRDVNERFVDAKKKFDSLVKLKPRKGSVITQNTAHITLKRTFYPKIGVDEEVIMAALSGVRFKPIPIFSNKLSVFRSKKFGNILVALVNDNSGLMELYDELTGAIDQYIEYEAKEFVPHLSILYNLPRNRIKEARSYTEKNILPVFYLLDNFSLLKDTGVVKERVLVKGYYP